MRSVGWIREEARQQVNPMSVYDAVTPSLDECGAGRGDGTAGPLWHRLAELPAQLPACAPRRFAQTPSHLGLKGRVALVYRTSRLGRLLRRLVPTSPKRNVPLDPFPYLPSQQYQTRSGGVYLSGNRFQQILRAHQKASIDRCLLIRRRERAAHSGADKDMLRLIRASARHRLDLVHPASDTATRS